MNKHKFNIYPEIVGEEFETLKESIANGYDNTLPIIVYQGAILDGWNRYRACQELGILAPEYEFVGTDEEALNYVIRTNNRRDLTSSQRACIALEYLPLFETAAKERMLAGIKNNPVELVPQGKSRDDAGKQLNVSGRYVAKAQRIKEKDPEAFKEILAGTKTVSEVEKEIRKQEIINNLEDIKVKESKAIEGIYDVIVIDPPWEMNKIEVLYGAV